MKEKLDTHGYPWFQMEVAPNFSALHVFWFDETGDVDATTEAAMGPKLNALGVVLR